MANTYPLAGKSTGKLSIAATDPSQTIVIGSGSKRLISSLQVHIVVASGTLSIAVKGRSSQVQAGRGNDDVAFLPIPYRKLALNGAVGDDSYVPTAITGSSILLIPSSGTDVALDLTQTDGVFDVYVTPLEGAAA